MWQRISAAMPYAQETGSVSMHKTGVSHRLSPNPRRHALEVISQALSPSGRGFAQDLLEDRFARAPLKTADRRLAADLAYGVIRRLATLDAVLAAYSSRPIEQIDSGILQILRMGLYQILFQERVPTHAAVDEAVRLARATGKKHATGFVNAVLRTMARDLTLMEHPDPARPRKSFEINPGRACLFGRPVLPTPADVAPYLAASLSFPVWLVRRWLARFGTSRTREFLSHANHLPPLFVRPNSFRISAEKLAERLREEKVDAAPSPSGRTLRLPPHTQVGHLRSFTEGLFQVQDDSSAAVAPFLDPRPDQRVLDLCAAPGGKTCHCAELMENRGQIIAVDASRRRLQRVVENMQRMDHSIIATVESDGADFAVQNPEKVDRVLLDAPCSNTGVLRRRVEVRWRLGDKPLAALAHKQRDLLRAALRALKPGGVLVYSTCSLEPEENGELVASVLRGRPGFTRDAEEATLPSRDGGDGLTMARILRGDRPEGVKP